MVELKEEYYLCDIWRIRNPLEKSFTFQQNHFSGIINRRLYYTYISNKLQEFSNKVIRLPVFKTDNPFASFIISNFNEIKAGPGLRKFTSLISDKYFTNKLNNFIQNLKEFSTRKFF